MSNNTREAAKGKWYGILTALGIDQSYLRNVHGPCPVCQGEDRFRFDDKDGAGTYYCTSCEPGDGFALAMNFTGQDFATVAKRIDGLVGNVEARAAVQDDKPDPRLRLNKIRAGLVKCTGSTPVDSYLSSRGVGFGARFVGFHPSQSYWQGPERLGIFPAMVSTITSSAGKPIGYHLTYLTPDGKKADVPSVKKTLPCTEDLAGAAIRLGPIREHMGIAEGIETALAAAKLYKMPVWAGRDDTGLAKFVPPKGVAAVTIYGDADASYAGQAAAYALAKRLKGRGIDVSVMLPDRAGVDFADLLPL